MADINQWSSVKGLVTADQRVMTSWIPPDDQDRIAAYFKYDDMYWNDPRQYSLRVLEGEQPLYIPNARTIVDTTSHYLLKGLKIEVRSENQSTNEKVDAFLKREAFYSRFHTAKQAGVARGDFLFHLTANPLKAPGTKLSLNSVEPAMVFPIWDEDEPGRMTGCHLAQQYKKPDDPNTYVRRLTYRLEVSSLGIRRVSREEAIYKLDGGWWTPKAEKVKQIIPYGLLDERITSIPIYWFKNRHWQGEDYGSSELRGLESISQVISQAASDVAGSLSLEGLGVYATDGGRPIDETGAETEWEVAPGKVMEVPSGAYFRRVEGVGSITPATDMINYLEDKMHEASGLGDIALGKIDAQVAESGIALAIKFIPTLAKIEIRDQLGIDILTQLFYDFKTWYAVFEQETLDGDIIPVIGDKLPTDRVAKVNELNNMVDRKIITGAFYRSEMEKLGYIFPKDIEAQLDKEAMKALERTQAVMAAKDTEGDSEDETSKGAEGSSLPSAGNKSNNRNRPNESKGTEAE